MKKRIISAVLTASVILSSQSLFFDVQKVSADDTIKIMSVGDSITDGYWEQGGYRKYMYHALAESGINNIDMVGAKGSNEESYSNGDVSFTYDGNYSGYSGYAIQYIEGTETRQGILETMQSETYGDSFNQNMMEAYQPDIVLLQIGTNDVLSAYNDGITDRLENLCDYILSYLNEDDTLFVSTIPNIDTETVYDWFWAYGNEYWNTSKEDFIVKIQNYVDTYNNSIKEMVAKKQSNGIKNIQFADINSVVDYKTDLYDGIHPNEQGYQKMGEYWSDTLKNYIDNKEVPPITTTTSAPITTTTTTTSVSTDDITTTEPTITTIISTSISTTSIEVTTTPITTTTDITTSITTDNPIIEYPKGDINLDGKVSYVDLLLLKKNILLDIVSWNANYDVNGDNTINTLDVVTLKSILLENGK